MKVPGDSLESPDHLSYYVAPLQREGVGIIHPVGCPRFGRKKNEPGSSTIREAIARYDGGWWRKPPLFSAGLRNYFFIKIFGVTVIRLLNSYYYYHKNGCPCNRAISSFCWVKCLGAGAGAGQLEKNGSS
ncbi:MAG: hypothetical protein D3909_13965 [Candidatus Electrothrix sp. ATG1]|nr:hypothetical protein [Candidatus Electrothrix sp. ATG1]